MPDISRVEAAARAIVNDLDEHAGGGNWNNTNEAERFLARKLAGKVLAAADEAALGSADGLAELLNQVSRAMSGRVPYFAADALKQAAATLQAQASRIADLEAALKAATGYLLNAKIDLQTASKKTAIQTIDGGLKVVRAALGKEG